jgi:hypothetical protein
MITPIEARLVKYFLSRCSNELAKHGCNDLDLVQEMGLSPEESFRLRKAMREDNGDAEENPEHPDRHYTSDWWVAAYLSSRVGDEFGIPTKDFKYKED